MSGHAHYVSLMRAKSAELKALRGLAPMLRSWIAPMLECPSCVLRRCESLEELEASSTRSSATFPDGPAGLSSLTSA